VVPIYRGIAAEAGSIKPLAIPNGSPSTEGSGDYNDTLVPINSLKHICMEPTNRSASSEKNCKPKTKPEEMCYEPYRRTASDGLRRRTAKTRKETTAA
jgi:hypothetical protein